MGKNRNRWNFWGHLQVCHEAERKKKGIERYGVNYLCSSYLLCLFLDYCILIGQYWHWLGTYLYNDH